MSSPCTSLDLGKMRNCVRRERRFVVRNKKSYGEKLNSLLRIERLVWKNKNIGGEESKCFEEKNRNIFDEESIYLYGRIKILLGGNLKIFGEKCIRSKVVTVFWELNDLLWKIKNTIPTTYTNDLAKMGKMSPGDQPVFSLPLICFRKINIHI